MTMAGRIVVSDPGFLPTTRQMALALDGDLDLYCTPFAATHGSRLLRLPALGPLLGRRTLPPELATRVRTCTTATELARVALSRTGPARAAAALLVRRNTVFDRRVARLVRPGDTVIGPWGASLAAFTQAGETGTCVLDYPIARLELGVELLEEEARRRPDWADSLFGSGAVDRSTARVERISREIEAADAVVVGSAFAAASFPDGVRVHAIPYGVDTSRFSPAGERAVGPLRVLFAGHLSQRKGVADLLDALRLLDPDRYSLTLVGMVIGSGRGLAAHAGRFRHIGGVRPQEMPAIYRAADVLVLPSLYEGSALVVLEAMASGLPVIVTPNAGANAVRDGVDGFVVPVRAPAEIARRLAELEHDREHARQMGAVARERSLAFDWRVFRERFRALLLELGALPADEAGTP